MSTPLVINGKTVESGTEMTIHGLGRSVFLAYTKGPTGAEWIDVITSKGRSRTVRPDRIRIIHRNRRLAVRP